MQQTVFRNSTGNTLFRAGFDFEKKCVLGRISKSGLVQSIPENLEKTTSEGALFENYFHDPFFFHSSFQMPEMKLTKDTDRKMLRFGLQNVGMLLGFIIMVLLSIFEEDFVIKS